MFRVGDSTGRSLLQLPTGKKAFGQIELLKGDAMRNVQGNLIRCARLIGDERGAIWRTRIGRKEYNASLAPTSRMARSVAYWGGRPVVNLFVGDLQLPPILDNPRYDRSDRGQSVNRGLIARDGFGDASLLRDIARQGQCDGRLRGVLTRIRTYSLTEGDAVWMMSLHLDKSPTGEQK